MREYRKTKREVTSEQKIELAKLQLAKLEKEIELQLAKNKALSLNPAAKVEENTLAVETKEKREIVLNRRPELYRGKYRCVQPKINLLKKDVLMPVKHNVFLWNLPDVEEVPT
ncbi:hypothetical protein TNCV_1775761 [Trichonephila clavipes]|nr:hypothetical protein TNCV_1775761 [Trichonephila clavipes]